MTRHGLLLSRQILSSTRPWHGNTLLSNSYTGGNSSSKQESFK